MNCLSKLSKNIKHNQRKQKINYIKGIAVFSVLSVAIGRSTAMLLAKSRLDKKKNNTTISPEESNEENNESINIKRNEIKHTLEEFGEEVIGDVGVAMEKALENLEDDKQNENEIAK